MRSLNKVRNKKKTTTTTRRPVSSRPVTGGRGVPISFVPREAPVPTKRTFDTRSLQRANALPGRGRAGPPSAGRDMITAMRDLTESEVDESTVEAVIITPYSTEEIRRMSLFNIVVSGEGGTREKSLSFDDPRLGARQKVPCTTCGADYNNCPGHYARIEFGEGVYIWNPFFVKQAATVLQCVCRSCANLIVDPALLRDRHIHLMPTDLNRLNLIKQLSLKTRFHHNTTENVKCKQNPVYKVVDETERPMILVVYEDGDRTSSAPMNIAEALAIFKLIPPEHLELMGFKAGAHPAHFIMNNLLVEPPCSRPLVYDETRVQVESKNYNNIAETVWKIRSDPEKREDWISELSEHVANLIFGKASTGLSMGRKSIKSTSERIKGNSGKEGIFRKIGVGARPELSGRTVAGPDPNIELDQISVPWVIAKEFAIPETVADYNRRLWQRRVDEAEINSVLRNGYIADLKELRAAGRHFELKNGDKVLRPLQDGDWVLINRQPSLNKNNIPAFRAVISRERKNIGIRPEVVSGFNLDFDGDELTIHAITSERGRAEAKLLLNITKCLIGEASNSPVIGSILDSVTAGYDLSRTEDIPEEIFPSLIPLDITDTLGANALGRVLESPFRNMWYIPGTIMGQRITQILNAKRPVYSTDLEIIPLDDGTRVTGTHVLVDFESGTTQPVLIEKESPYYTLLTLEKYNPEQRQQWRDILATVASVPVQVVESYWYKPGSRFAEIVTKRSFIGEDRITPILGRSLLTGFHITRALRDGVEVKVVLDQPEEVFNLADMVPVTIAYDGAKYRLGFDTESAFGQRLRKYGVPPFSGRALISALLPASFNYESSNGSVIIREGIMVRGFLDKSTAGIASNSIIHRLYLYQSDDVAIRFIQQFAILTNNWLHYRAISPGVEDCKLEPEVTAAIRKEINEAISGAKEAGVTVEGETADDRLIRERKIQNIVNIVERIGRMIMEKLPEDNAMKLMAKSGGKGSAYNIGMMMGLIGQQFVNGSRPSQDLGGVRCTIYYGADETGPETRGFGPESYYVGIREPGALLTHYMASREALRATAEGSSKVGYSRRKEFVAIESAIVGSDQAVRSSNERVVMNVYGGDGMEPKSLLKVALANDKVVRGRRAPEQVLHFVDIPRLIADLNLKHGITDSRLEQDNYKRLLAYFLNHQSVTVPTVNKDGVKYFGREYDNTISQTKTEGGVEITTRVINSGKATENLEHYLNQIAAFLGTSTKPKDLYIMAIDVINRGLEKPAIHPIIGPADVVTEIVQPDLERIAGAIGRHELNPLELAGTDVYMGTMIELDEDSTIL